MFSEKRPYFSVVIPCYNEEDYIEKTIRSLKAQNTKANYEIIVVDNNCTDATASIARKLGAKVVVETIPGICAARQAGTNAAQGEIVISTDADTIFSPDWLENIYKEFKKSSKIVAVCGPCRFNDSPWWGKVYTHFLFGWSYFFFLVRGRPIYITATNTAFRKASWKGYDLSLMQGGDEIGLLHQLKREGKVSFGLKNSVYTSGRRLQRGMLYNIFVTFLFYYMAGYYINSLFGRKIIGAPPAFRKPYKTKWFTGFTYGTSTLVVAVLIFAVNGHNLVSGFVSDSLADFTSFIGRLF